MNPTVLCYGGICVDNIIHVPYMPTPGIATTPTHQQFQLGGGAALTAVWLAHWGLSVRLSGNAIGTDHHADQILSWLHAYPAIDTSYIQQSSDVTSPYAHAIVPPNGDRYLIEIGYNTAPMVKVRDIDLNGIDILTVSFYYNNPEQETRRLAKIAHDKGITVIASDVLDEGNPLFKSSSILINSRAVMAKILPDINHRDYTIDLQKKYGGTIIMTDGENPVFAVDQDGKTYNIEVPKVKVHDATGAGDAFRAGIVYGLLHDWVLEESLKLAVATGSLQVERNASEQPPASLEETQALTYRIMRQ